MLGPGERVVESDSTRLIPKGERTGASVEDVSVGPKNERRSAQALGNTRLGGRIGLANCDLVIGKHGGERLQIAPRIAGGALRSDKNTVARFPKQSGDRGPCK